MANIVLKLPKTNGSTNCQFRVDWESNDSRTRQRHFRSYELAERFALMCETRLINETLESLVTTESRGLRR